MTESGGPTIEDRRRVGQTVFGHMAAQTLAAAVRLGVPAHLPDAADGSRHASEVAAALGTQPAATERLLRALAATGFAAETAAGTFALTGAGMLLRADRPDSLATFVTMFLDPTMIASWQHLDRSVGDGAPAFDAIHGVDFFTHLAARPELSAMFNASMRQGTLAAAAELPSIVDLTRFTSLTDVGGGDGTLLAAALAACPDLHGVLFDTAAGSAEAGPVIAPVADRCAVVVGDFFAAVPAGSDAYLLKSIVHDWDDDRAARILSHVRSVIPDDGRLLIVEPVLPEVVDGSTAPITYLSDLNMLVNVGGRERTEGEFRTLCARAGFEVTAVRPFTPPSAFRVLEAVPR